MLNACREPVRRRTCVRERGVCGALLLLLPWRMARPPSLPPCPVLPLTFSCALKAWRLAPAGPLRFTPPAPAPRSLLTAEKRSGGV
jgi:hypothetical protein